MPKRYLEIRQFENNDFEITVGDRYANHLSADEALYTVAQWFINPERRGYLRERQEIRALAPCASANYTVEEDLVESEESYEASESLYRDRG